MHGGRPVLARGGGCLAEDMQALQQLVAVQVSLALALHQVRACQILLQLLHCPAVQELKGTDVGSVLVLKDVQQLLSFPCKMHKIPLPSTNSQYAANEGLGYLYLNSKNWGVP